MLRRKKERKKSKPCISLLLYQRQLLSWELVRVVIRGPSQPPLTPLDRCCYDNEAPLSPHFLLLLFLPPFSPACLVSPFLSLFFYFTIFSKLPHSIVSTRREKIKKKIFITRIVFLSLSNIYIKKQSITP